MMWHWRICGGRSAATMLLVGLVAAVGCGTADYEAKMNASLVEFRRNTPFVELFLEPTRFPETPLSVRLPTYLGGKKTAVLDQKTPDPRDAKKPLDEGRVEPDFLQLPGYVRTYETFVDVPRETGPGTLERPVYCYIAMVSDKKKPALDLEVELRDQLLAHFGALRDATPAIRSGKTAPSMGVGDWTEIIVPTPDGTNLLVKKLVAIGDQTFHYYDPAGGEVKTKFLPGKYVVYLYDAPRYNVLIAWRAQLTTAEHVKMEARADTTAGTIDLHDES